MKECKEINGFEGYYSISENGQLFSVKRKVKSKSGGREVKERILKTHVNKLGYERVVLRKEGKDYNYSVHRLVAINFIPNPHNLACVNHKNGIKSDNKVENLEWVSRSENTIHAIDTGLISLKNITNRAKKAALNNKKTVICSPLNKQFSSINEAAIFAKVPCSNISRALKRGIKAGGYQWSYA